MITGNGGSTIALSVDDLFGGIEVERSTEPQDSISLHLGEPRKGECFQHLQAASVRLTSEEAVRLAIELVQRVEGVQIAAMHATLTKYADTIPSLITVLQLSVSEMNESLESYSEVLVSGWVDNVDTMTLADFARMVIGKQRFATMVRQLIGALTRE